jgi:hypothetical protein
MTYFDCASGAASHRPEEYTQLEAPEVKICPSLGALGRLIKTVLQFLDARGEFFYSVDEHIGKVARR